jgi:hypothetical protein
MHRFAVLGLSALALMACATADETMLAQNQCASVGITPKDADFATCMQAYRQQRREDALTDNYHNAINAVPSDRRMGHEWVY